MNLGVFSMSLNVTDLEVSREFYKKLGFDDFGGNIETVPHYEEWGLANWVIQRNDPRQHTHL